MKNPDRLTPEEIIALREDKRNALKQLRKRAHHRGHHREPRQPDPAHATARDTEAVKSIQPKAKRPLETEAAFLCALIFSTANLARRKFVAMKPSELNTALQLVEQPTMSFCMNRLRFNEHP